MTDVQAADQEIVVIGAGGIGGMIAARLARTGRPVRLVVRPGKAVLYTDGIRVRDAGGTTWSAPIAVSEHISELDPARVGLVVVATKAFDTGRIVRELAAAGLAGVSLVCAQNTTVNEPIAARLTDRVAGLVVYFGADSDDQGVISDRGDPLTITLGIHPDGTAAWLAAFGEACRQAGFAVTMTDALRAVRWNKQVLNLDSALSAICSVTNDRMRSDPALVEFRTKVREEAHAVLTSADVRYLPLAPIELKPSDPALPASYSSTWHDLAQHRGRVETQLINGEIVRFGIAAGIPTPYNTVLTRLCLEMAANGIEPGWLDPTGLQAAVDREIAAGAPALDPHRPTLHVMPPSGWLNDPNGPFLWHDRYHLFFQYNPDAPVWESPHWGHASSDDLVTWAFDGIALSPGPEAYDTGGCFSGCVVDDHGTPTMVYTGVAGAGPGRVETTCIARGDAELAHWRKDAGNPVALDPGGPSSLGFRDPFVWRAEDGDWRKLVGSGRDGAGSILLYRSADLLSWELVATLFSQGAHDWPGIDTGSMWECPQLVRFGDRHLLILSVYRHRDTIWFSGSFDGTRFVPEAGGRFDHGSGYFAPAVLVEPAGRVLVWGWCRESRDEAAVQAAGWAGVMSFPRTVELGADGHPRLAFARELEALRREDAGMLDTRLSPDAVRVLSRDAGAAEIRLRVAAEDAPFVTLALLRSPDGIEQTTIGYDGATGELVVDRTESCREPGTDTSRIAAELPLGARGLDLHIFVDGSLIEVIANGRIALTARAYPVSPWATGAALTATRTVGTVEAGVWPLTSGATGVGGPSRALDTIAR